jgi:hypothetical protein
MSKFTASKLTLSLAAVGTAVLAACASVDTGIAWNILPAGSTWQVEQRNTGSYGQDVIFTTTRGEALWQGSPAITFVNSPSGVTVMAMSTGKWMAVVGRDGRPLVTYDPPIGYVYPLSVGRTWSTQHRITLPRGTTDITYQCKVEAPRIGHRPRRHLRHPEDRLRRPDLARRLLDDRRPRHARQAGVPAPQR